MAYDGDREATIAHFNAHRRADDLHPEHPGEWYVTIHRGKRCGFLAGPYTTAGEANANEPKASRLAIEADDDAVWDLFCTTNVRDPRARPRRVVFTQEELDSGEVTAPASSGT